MALWRMNREGMLSVADFDSVSAEDIIDGISMLDYFEDCKLRRQLNEHIDHVQKNPQLYG